MKISNADRISKINVERIIMLEQVKEGLKNGNTNICNNIDYIRELIYFDQKNLEKYNTINDIKEIIAGLVNDISNCKDIDEIIKLRKRVNYYINKIKKELVSRNISDQEINIYMENTAYLRKSMAKYVSFLKRENKIDEMTSLDKKETLSDEETDKLKKLIRNEERYNKNFDVSNTPNKKEKKVKNNIDDINDWLIKGMAEEKDIDDDFSALAQVIDNKHNNKVDDEKSNLNVEAKEDTKDNKDSDFTFVFDDKKDDKETLRDKDFNDWIKSINLDDKKDNKDSDFTFIFDDKKDEKESLRDKEFDEWIESINLEDKKDNKDFDVSKYIDSIKTSVKNDGNLADESSKLQTKYNFYCKYYGMSNPKKYGASFGGNLVNFCANIPRYINNKRAIKDMKTDYNYFYRGDNFRNFITYSEKRNSIIRAFKQIFDSSYLLSDENQCINNHEMFMEWINKYNNDKLLTKKKQMQ